MNTNKKEKFINKNNAVHKRFWQIGIRTFFVFLFVIAFIGLLLPLRPNIGRCSNYILKDRKDTLNFFVYAPEEVRIQATMEKKNIGRKEAAELVKYHDEMLHSRYKYMTGSYRGDRKGRHMMIDSSVLGWEKTAQYMLQMIDLRFED